MLNTSDLIGTWQLKTHSQFPDGAKGLLIYHPNLSMAVVIHGKILKAGHLSDHTIAYAGTFSIDEECIFHHVIVSDNPSRIGPPQIRVATLIKDLLTLSAPGSDGSGVAITWEKKEITEPHIG